MTEDNRFRVSPSEATDSASVKRRKQRKWDQPAESLISTGMAVPGILPLSNMGFAAGITSPGIPNFSTNPFASTGATLLPVLQVPLQQNGATIVQKLNQPKIQDELIAREIVINDADSAIRYRLTKRQTQEEIQKCTGAIVITRGKYRPPSAPPAGEKPLYLHISSGAHLETTAERIKAVDSAAAMVEEILKHGSSNNGAKVNNSLNTCVFLGFEADPSLDIAARIRGPNDQYVNHIMNETGATVLLRGRGSGNPDSIADEDGQQPLHLFLLSNSSKSLERAKLLAENLLDTISAEFGASRVSSSKVYGAVPPPPQLLAGVQSSGAEQQPNNLPAASHIASTPISASPVVSPVIVGTSSNVASHEIVSHEGWSSCDQSQAITCGSLSFTQGTSYIGYGGIYPQATPLQQVALALRQTASPVTATVAPATTAGGLASQASAGSSLQKDKRSSQKRKFQELPAAVKRPPDLHQNVLQGSELAKPCAVTSDVGARDTSDVSSSRRLIDEPSTSGMPPPPPRKISPPPLPAPPTSKSNPTPMPPLPPKFTPLLSVHDIKSTATESRAESVPDTLIKLMEYGDDDDDDEDEQPEEISQASFQRNSTDAPKPFWAV